MRCDGRWGQETAFLIFRRKSGQIAVFAPSEFVPERRCGRDRQETGGGWVIGVVGVWWVAGTRRCGRFGKNQRRRRFSAGSGAKFETDRDVTGESVSRTPVRDNRPGQRDNQSAGHQSGQPPDSRTSQQDNQSAGHQSGTTDQDSRTTSQQDSQSGQPARTAGRSQPDNSQGQPTRTAGQPSRTTSQGQPTRTAGQPVSGTTSQPDTSQGQPTRTAGQPVSGTTSQGQPTRTAGQLSQPDNQSGTTDQNSGTPVSRD